MKRLLLLSGCLIGLCLTECQKDALPDPVTAPQDLQEEVTTKAGEYAFYPGGVIELYLIGGQRNHSFSLYYKGQWAIGGHGTFWLEDMPGYPSINTYVQAGGGPTYGSPGYVTGSVSIKEGARLGEYTRGYLKFRATKTGETISQLVIAGPAPEL